MISPGEKEELPPEDQPIPLSGRNDYVTGCPANEVITRIAEIEDRIAELKNTTEYVLARFNLQKNQLLERAILEKIDRDDGAYLVEKPQKKVRNKIEDIATFAVTFPEEFDQIRQAQKRELEDKCATAIKNLPDSDIPLTLADKKIGKDRVTAFVGFMPQKIEYEVIKRTTKELNQ